MIQPCDGGIIKSLKCQYRSALCSRILLLLEEGGTDALQMVKKIQVIDAIFLLVDAWSKVTQQTIANCWRNCLAGVSTPIDQLNVQIPAEFTPATFLEQIDLEDFSSEEIEQEVEEYAVQMSNNENDKEEKEELKYDPPSVNDAIRGLQIVREYLQSSGGASSMDMEYLSRLEKRTLKDKLASKNHLNQKKISNFFNKS